MVGMVGMVWYCMQEEQEEAASLEGMVCYGRYGMVGMVWYCMQEEARGRYASSTVWPVWYSLVGMVCYGMVVHARGSERMVWYGMVSMVWSGRYGGVW